MENRSFGKISFPPVIVKPRQRWYNNNMKRNISVVVLVLFMLTAVFALAGCSEKAESIKFGKDYYSVRVGESVVPDVLVSPEIPYTLKTAFSGIAEVSEGAVKGIRRGITVLTAAAGGLFASVTVEVLAEDGTSNHPGDGKARVLYVVDARSESYYTNYVRYGETTPDLILEKNGYRFRGWYADSDFQTPFDFTAPISEDVTIYGRYDLIEGAETPFTYKISDGYLLVTGLLYPNVPYTEIEIPEKAIFEGVEYDVIGIENDCLTGLKSLVKISMPHLKILGKNALSNCPQLNEVSANNGLLYVSSGVLNGSKWLVNEQARRINGYYHGAQLGNCYLYALDSQRSVYLFDDSSTTVKVTLFAEGAFAEGTRIYVPSSLLQYYKSHPNLTSFRNLIYAY